MLWKKVDRTGQENGKTILHSLCAKKDCSFLGLILNAEGVNASARNERGATPLHYAAGSNHSDAIKILLDARADPDILNDYSKNRRGKTPLHRAATAGCMEACQALLDSGIDVSQENGAGLTALHFAAFNSRPKCVERFLKAGADAMFEDSTGATALHYASSAKVCHLLIEAGADVNHLNKYGATPLHMACCWDLSIVEILLHAGADIMAVDNDAMTHSRRFANYSWTRAPGLL